MTALCADPAYDPDWWSVDAHPYDRCVANGICARCPDRRQCAATAASTPDTEGLWGCRWFPPREFRPPRPPTAAQRLADVEFRLDHTDPDDPAILPLRRALLGLI